MFSGSSSYLGGGPSARPGASPYGQQQSFQNQQPQYGAQQPNYGQAPLQQQYTGFPAAGGIQQQVTGYPAQPEQPSQFNSSLNTRAFNSSSPLGFSSLNLPAFNSSNHRRRVAFRSPAFSSRASRMAFQLRRPRVRSLNQQE